MMEAARQWFNGHAERERRFVIYGGVAAIVIVLLMAVLPLQRSAAALEQRVATKRADLAWMRSVAPALAGAGPVSDTPLTQESLVVTVDRTARESSLGEALARSEPAGQGGQRVQLNGARFDVMVAWLARLRQQHGIGVVAATIERSGEPGLVNATVELNAL
ncbi:MAG TPA: type II secretion system protein M [Steroidobacteraceae bacterium]|nr:type II secretion system protein M [Steroidobacteraceae bacterium]HNS27156.1 type II secretion system protein M [Steroidobacteraceae bacterium]